MKLKGSVSLFTAMIFLFVVAVITMSIRSAKIQGAKVMVETAASMSMDSVFAEYDKTLFEEFGVLLFKSEGDDKVAVADDIAMKVSNYLDYNLDTNKDLISFGTDLYGISVDGINTSQMITAVDGGGLVWQDMVVDYEKYAKVINLAADYMDFEDNSDEAQLVKEISDDVVECTNKILQINKAARLLVNNIDGVICQDKGVNFKNIVIDKKFVKKLCPYEVTAENLSIGRDEVYKMVSQAVKNPIEIIDSAIAELKEKRGGKAKSTISSLSKLMEDCLVSIDTSIAAIEKINGNMTSLKGDLNNLDDKIQSNKDKLPEDVVEGIGEEVSELKEYDEILADQICDLKAMYTTLNSNKTVLNNAAELIKTIDFYGIIDKASEILVKVQKELSKYSFSGMEFDYSHLGVNLDENNIIDNLVAFFSDGILALVVPEGTKISEKDIKDYKDLASDTCVVSEADSLQKDMDEATKLTKKIIYSEYVMDKFDSFLDKKDTEKLDYQIEYILYGNDKDKTNLTETVLTIATIRSAFNLAYLYTDGEKRDACYAMAQTIAGASECEPLVRLVQFTLMYLWSYAEGLADVSVLLKGDKIEMTKTKDTWRVSFENLIKCNLKSDKKSSGNVDYDMFLRFLLYLSDDGKKSARTMDLVELYKILRGDKKFRLRNYIYGATIETSYSVAGFEYTQKTAYSY